MVAASSLTADERKAYNHLYNLADKEQLGVLTGDVAIVFFEKTQLPGHTLGEIWQLSDKEDTGFLTKEAFYTACRLIGHAQNGQTPSKSLADRSGPLPWFQGVTIPGLTKQPTQPSGTSRAPGTPTRQASTPVAPASPSPAAARPAQKPSSGGLSVSPEDKAKYTRLFYNAGPVAGLLDGDKASEILKKSRLPDEKLGQIWNLADTQSRGALDAGDFVIAMTLIQATMNGSLSALPDELPDNVYTQAGASKPGMASTLPNLGAMQTPSSPLRAQYTGNRAAAPGVSPIYPQNTGSMRPPARASTLGQSQNRSTGGAAWAITPLEKSQCDTFFAMLDTARSGSLSGDVAGPFFMQSGLSGDVLASIWDLSDIKNDGQLDKEEFALARRLVMDTLAGKTVPEKLEESFVPPSLRDQWRGSGQQQQVQQSEVQRDLFSLMDDDDASSLPAPVQQVGATAFNQQAAPAISQFQPGSQQGSRIASPAPLQPMLTGGSARSATPVRSAPPPVPATRLALASPPTNAAASRDFFDATPVDEEPPQLDERSAELGNLQNQVSQTQRSVSNLRSDRTKLTSEVNKIEEQINELKVSLSQAKAAYDTESTNMTNLEARHSKGSEELKNLKEETIRAESDLSGLKEQKAELEQSILKDKEESCIFRFIFG